MGSFSPARQRIWSPFPQCFSTTTRRTAQSFDGHVQSTDHHSAFPLARNDTASWRYQLEGTDGLHRKLHRDCIDTHGTTSRPPSPILHIPLHSSAIISIKSLSTDFHPNIRPASLRKINTRIAGLWLSRYPPLLPDPNDADRALRSRIHDYRTMASADFKYPFTLVTEDADCVQGAGIRGARMPIDHHFHS